MKIPRHPGIIYLETLLEQTGNLPNSFSPPARHAALLGDPQDTIRAIHVAGTNGKGSVCAYLSAILQAAGHRVGQFASPHLSDVTERCLINGTPVADEPFGEALLRVKDLEQQAGLPLSYFELTTLASFLVFQEHNLDWIVVEVGLGGRLDATNILSRPEVSVVTGIDYDHTQFLGTSLAAIAREKGGIFKTGRPAIVGDVTDEAYVSLREQAEEQRTPIEFWGRDFRFDEDRHELTSKHGSFVLPERLRNAPRSYQQRNAALAARVAQVCGVAHDAIEGGLSSARWPGRIEHLSTSRSPARWLLDVAHNLQGIAALIDYLRVYLQKHPEIHALTFMVGILDRKDWRGMLDQLRDFADELRVRQRAAVNWIFASSGHPHSVPAAELASYLHSDDAYEEPGQALQRAADLAERMEERVEGLLTVVTGSIYFVGKIRPHLCGSPDSPFSAERTIDR